jgi:hypothetical protein
MNVGIIVVKAVAVFISGNHITQNIENVEHEGQKGYFG